MQTIQLKKSTTLAIAVAVAVLGAATVTAQWGHRFGEQDATNRSDRAGLITGTGATSPGFVWTITRDPERLTTARLKDLDGNGEPEVLFVASGGVTSLDPQLTGPSWVSAPNGTDAILGLVEVDGDPATTEIVATSSSTAGGFEFIDGAFGGILGSIGGFAQLSGVLGSESAYHDLDGDGIEELIHPPARGGLGNVWITTLANGIANPGFLEVSFSGYANYTPAFVGDFLGTGDPVIIVDQGAEWTLFPTCAATDAGAVCDDGAGTVCLCPSTKYFSLNANFAFGPRWIEDTDGDGREELVLVGNSPSYIKAIGVFDFLDGVAGGAPDAAATRQWYRRYTAVSPIPDLEPLAEGPVDIDGDGELEIIVSFYNNDGNDTDALGGTPNEDGIDHASAVSVGIFDLATGALEASILDAMAWGTTDLDGDGILELVTSNTTDFTFSDGLFGRDVDCSGGLPCTLTTAWSAAGRTLTPDLASFENLRIPTAKLYTVDVDGDGFDELLAYDGTTLQALRADGAGGVTVPASRPLQEDEQVIADDADTNTALLSSNEDVTVLNAGLGTIGAPVRLPPRGWDHFNAASVDGGAREVPIFSGGVFATETAPATLDQADMMLYPGFGLAADLNGDGSAEVVSYANPGSLDGDDASFEIRVDRWNPATSAFDTAWEFDSASDIGLDGYAVGPPLHFATGNFDGAGSDDLVVEVSGGGVFQYLVLDGDTGVLDTVFTPTQRVATSSPLFVADLVDGSGAAGADGIDDLIIPGSTTVSLHTVASGELWSTSGGNFIHGVTAIADTDGDGERELVATVSVGVDNQAEVIDGFAGGAPTANWGPIVLPLPTGSTQVLAFADVDTTAGADLVYITGDGGLHAFAGTTGVAIPGLPVYLAGGALTTTAPDTASPPLSLITMDVDDDGFEEAIVGTTDGTIYAVDIAADDPNAPGLAWTFTAGAAVRALAAADTDGDGYDEVLVSTDNGQGSALDGIGVQITITEPVAGDCVPATTFEVTGTSVGLTTVVVDLSGNSISGATDASTGTWSALAEARGTGTFLLTARGQDANGVDAAFDSALVAVGEDGDSDGWYACGDCDDADADRNPGATEVCDDGIDQDCDGLDLPCGDDDDSAGDDDDDDDSTVVGDDDDSGTEPPPTDCADCEGCSASGPSSSHALLLLFIAGLAVRRRMV